MEMVAFDIKDRLKQIRWLRSCVVFVKHTLNPPPNQWARIVMESETNRLVSSLAPETRSALEISGDHWRMGPFRQYRSIDFSEYDVCNGMLDERFDIIIAEQVFEHVLWPYRAARNVFAMLNPGGALLITTPFLVKIHENPTDCSRWTEIGIKHLLAEAGFNIEMIITGSWGNRSCIRANLRRWCVYYRPWIHSLKDEPDYPIVIWALARK
jgi:hypothetical protein